MIRLIPQWQNLRQQQASEGTLRERGPEGFLLVPFDHLAQSSQGPRFWLLCVYFFMLMSHLHETQLRGKLTNCCLLLISFVVKSPLTHDCLAEIALHKTQLEQDSQDRLIENHISPGIHLPLEVLVITSPSLEISLPSARPSASHSKFCGYFWESIRGKRGSHNKFSVCDIYVPSIFKYLLIMLLVGRKRKIQNMR